MPTALPPKPSTRTVPLRIQAPGNKLCSVAAAHEIHGLGAAIPLLSREEDFSLIGSVHSQGREMCRNMSWLFEKSGGAP